MGCADGMEVLAVTGPSGVDEVERGATGEVP